MHTHKLVNFNVPNYLLKNFDNLAKHKAITRTSMLITLMENYVREEVDQIEKDNRLNSLINEIDERNRRTLGSKIKDTVRQVLNEDTSPPSIQWDRGNDW